jgi:ribosome-binding factor A
VPRDHQRSHRVEEQIHRLLAELIRREVRDPRVGPLTITAVEVSRDLSHAKVFFLPFGADRPTDGIQQALGSAAGFLRIHLKKHLKMRHVPELHFAPDETIDKAVRLSALINSAVASDVERAATAPAAESDAPPDEP